MLLSGGTHAEAAHAAGVHRVTVTRWTNHHPAVVAELNRARTEALMRQRVAASRLTEKAIAVIDEALDDGDRAVALRWYSMNVRAIDIPELPVESADVVEARRLKMPSTIDQMIAATGEPSRLDAEAAILTSLDSPT